MEGEGRGRVSFLPCCKQAIEMGLAGLRSSGGKEEGGGEVREGGGRGGGAPGVSLHAATRLFERESARVAPNSAYLWCSSDAT
jgi:hypothetical protein